MSLVHNSPDALIFLDQDLTIRSVNPGFTHMFGYSGHEAVGRSFAILCPDQEAFERIRAQATPALRAKGNWRGEAHCRLKSGAMHIFDVLLARTGGTDSAECLAILRDITEARRAQQNYEMLFREMLNGCALHEIVCDEQDRPVDYRFLAVNPAFERMTGLKAGDIIGRSVLEVLPNTEKSWIETYGKVALTGEPVLFESYSGALQRHYTVTAFQPAPRQFACIFDDITERKRGEKEKARMEMQLAQAHKMDALGTLASGIAHDFNNLLAVIMGYSELAQEELPEGNPAREDIAEITKAAAKAKSLVRQILTFSRKAEVDRKTMSLNQAVMDAANMLKRTIPKMVRLEFDLADEVWPVKADPQQIEQIVLNMTSNAADAIIGGGRVSISTSNVTVQRQHCEICGELFSGDYVLISIKDSGTGMSPATKSKIFDPFFTTKELGKGTGLGLSTVYGILINHGGHVTCQSEPGAGTDFLVYLPAAEESIHQAQETGHALEQALPREATILVVDDEPAIRDIAAKILLRNGCSVLQAGTGEEALAIYGEKRGEIDCVLMDLGMPGMGGKGCLAEIRKRDPKATVLIASGYIQYELSDELQTLGAAGMVAKPYRKGDLLNILHQVLRR